MPASERSSSQKREVPSARSRISRSVHFPQTISAVLQTGHVSSTAISTVTLPTEVTPGGPRPGDGTDLGGHGERRRGLGLALALGGGDVLHGRAPASVRLHQKLEIV